MSDLVFFASKQSDGTWKLIPQDLTDPDDRDFLDENVSKPETSNSIESVNILGTIRKLTVYHDDKVGDWGWVKVSEAFP